MATQTIGVITDIHHGEEADVFTPRGDQSVGNKRSFPVQANAKLAPVIGKLESDTVDVIIQLGDFVHDDGANSWGDIATILALSDPEHLGATRGAYTLSRRLTILHSYRLGVSHLSFGTALHAVGLH